MLTKFLYEALKSKVGEETAKNLIVTIEYKIGRKFIDNKEVFATKSDIVEIKKEISILKSEMVELRSELKTEMADLRSDMATLRSELKTEISDFRSEIKTEIAELRSELKTEIAELRSELKTDIAELKSEFKSLNTKFNLTIAVILLLLVLTNPIVADLVRHLLK